MIDDVLLNKSQIIERCLKRIREEYVGHESEFSTNLTRQDSIILNLQRACEASLDIAQHIVSVNKLGVPQSYRDTILLLETAHILTPDLSIRMQKMIGFRNIAIHTYQLIDLNILRSILSNHLADFEKFLKVIFSHFN